jgi:hypothetical protein
MVTNTTEIKSNGVVALFFLRSSFFPWGFLDKVLMRQRIDTSTRVIDSRGSSIALPMAKVLSHEVFLATLR